MTRIDPEELLASARALADGPFLERAAEHDREGVHPAANFRDLHDCGLLALTVPREYGGAGASWETYLACLRELARGCGSTANAFNMHAVILRFLGALGSEDLKAKIFRAVVDEGALVATLTNEPQMSLRTSFQIQTTVEERGDVLVVDGTKHFCSLSTAARWYHVFGYDAKREAPDCYRSVLVPADRSGITVHDDWDVMAMRATASNSITFDQVEVDPALETGAPGALPRSGMQEYFTPGYAAIYLGVADAAFRFTAEYAKKTVFAGRDDPISHRPAAQRAAAEMAVSVAAAEALVEKAAIAGDTLAPLDASQAFQIAKYQACNTAREVATLALEVCGGRALSKRYPLERYIRDAQAGHLMQPTADVCRTRIGRRVLGIDPYAD